MNLLCKVAIVTGGTGGIGSAIVRALCKEGINVAVIDRDASTGCDMESDLQQLAGTVKFIEADVSSYPACNRAFQEVIQAFGQPDLIVNNVGISPKTNGHASKVWEMSPTEWDSVISVNLNSAFYFSRLAAEGMIQKKYGRIINMSSVAGKAYCDIVGVHYAATKAALIGFTRHLAGELGEFGITVNALAPGRINTPMMSMVSSEVNTSVTNITALKRLGTPEEVADACCFLASEESKFITGQIVDVAGGWLMT